MTYHAVHRLATKNAPSEAANDLPTWQLSLERTGQGVTHPSAHGKSRDGLDGLVERRAEKIALRASRASGALRTMISSGCVMGCVDGYSRPVGHWVECASNEAKHGQGYPSSLSAVCTSA